MICRLTAAQLVAATYGNSFTPSSAPPMHVLAQDLTNAQPIQGVFDDAVKAWYSADVADPQAALDQARTDLATKLNAQFPGHNYLLASAQQYYVPIFDENGNYFGHLTVAWLMDGSNPIFQEFPGATGQFEIGIVAAVIVGVGRK